jgi:hypothetical protein
MWSGSRNLCETLAGFNGEGLKELNIQRRIKPQSLFIGRCAFEPQPCERGLGIGRFLIAD